jgi:predicted amidohydrolase
VGARRLAFRQIARDNRIHLLPGSLFQVENGQTFNVTLVIDPSGTVVARYSKMFPFPSLRGGRHAR